MDKTEIEYKLNIQEEQGYFVDFGDLWSGTLSGNRKIQVTGYCVFTKEGRFLGLLSEDKAVLWYVEVITLHPEGKELLQVDEKEERETEEFWLLNVYLKRYLAFIYNNIGDTKVNCLDECPSIVADCHTLARMQELMPAILFTEEKIEKLRKLWAGSAAKEDFCYCCGKPMYGNPIWMVPVGMGLSRSDTKMFVECMRIIAEGIPWAEEVVWN